MREQGRRSTEVRGYVNFPIDSPEYKSSGEGGMFVRLVVYEKDGNLPPWQVCSGGHSIILMDESFLGDDIRTDPEVDYENLDVDEWNKTTFGSAGNFHFPHMYDEEVFSAADKNLFGEMKEYLSIPYLAIINLGSTGWSGFSQERGYWICSYEDLTDKGKSLYDQVNALYGENCQVCLQTWLDT